MRRFNHLVAGTVLTGGLLIGGIAGSIASASAATIPLLPTTTSVVASETAAGVVHSTATVAIDLVDGLLVTPSGAVTFTATQGNSHISLGSGYLSACLLGLGGETCKTTVKPGIRATDALERCGTWTITATYTGDTDLLAQASSGTTKFGTESCGSESSSIVKSHAVHVR
jgi:hypothetical protein